MDALERLHHSIDEHSRHLQENVPADREGAILAILRLRDALPDPMTVAPAPDLLFGRHLSDPGSTLALAICLTTTGTTRSTEETLPAWARQFLGECGSLARAGIVLRHVESGFMRLATGREDHIDAWITTRRSPAMWRERAGVATWASWLARRQRADWLPARLGYQLGYSPDAVIGDFRLQTALDVLRGLISRVTSQDADAGPVIVRDDDLITELAREVPASVADLREAIAAFTLDRGNASWHAAVPGVAAAPIIRLDPNRLALSRSGLMTEPILFLMRELRRRAPEPYHNAAHLREGVFRQDLYGLFADRRFVRSEGRIRLRHASGTLRTDIDAAIFDRKTGTLGIFELKSQDPYARTTASLLRQRDNVLYADRQVAGILDWINRNGANEILQRIDASTARTFRVHRVVPFVLGRFLGRFDNGPAPDRRSAWGSWPDVLRAFDEQGLRMTDANPLASLFTRLSNDDRLLFRPEEMPALEMLLGETRIVVSPSYAAMQGRGV